MAFDTTTYLSWYVPRIRSGDGALNLHSSGVVALDPEQLEVHAGNPWLATGDFEELLADWLGHPPEEVIFTPGATGGTLLALLSATAPGSEVIVEAPIYEPMLRQAERVATVRRLPRTAARGWRFDLDQARALIGDATSMILLTEPHNPSGVLAPRQDVLALAALAAEHGATLLINEVYRGWTDAPTYHGAAPNIWVVGSLSKLLGAYWARLGWLSAPPEAITRLHRTHINFSGMQTAPSASVGLAVLRRADALVRAARDRARDGLAVMDRWIADTPGVSWHRPDGTGYGCVALPPGTDDMALAETLHQKHGVLLVPGTLWEVPGTLRISWLQASPEELETGLTRLAALL